MEQNVPYKLVSINFFSFKIMRIRVSQQKEKKRKERNDDKKKNQLYPIYKIKNSKIINC